jgi:hypothetical protein
MYTDLVDNINDLPPHLDGNIEGFKPKVGRCRVSSICNAFHTAGEISPFIYSLLIDAHIINKLLGFRFS